MADRHYEELTEKLTTYLREISQYKNGVYRSLTLTLGYIKEVRDQQSSGFFIWLTGESNEPSKMYPQIIDAARREIMDAYRGFQYGMDAQYSARITAIFEDFKASETDPYKADVLVEETKAIHAEYRKAWASFELIRTKVLSWMTLLKFAAANKSAETRTKAIENAGETLTTVYSEAGKYVAKQAGGAFVAWVREHPLIVLGIGVLIYWAFFTPSGKSAVSKGVSGAKTGGKWAYEEGKYWGSAAMKARG